MIDLSGFQRPENAPEPGACIRVERPESELVVVRLDPPHRKIAVLDAPLLEDLDRVVTELENDRNVRGVVLTGRDATQFAAGADVEAIASAREPEEVERVVIAVHELFERIARLAPTTVAAVGGPVPGGALEISLACDVIVATDDPKTRIGLPEVLLGILPAWGGSHRLPWKVGLPNALDAILSGRLYPAKAAWKRGIVDRLTKPEYLLRVASDIALGREALRRRKRGWKTWLVDRNPLAKSVIKSAATKQIQRKTKGHYPAPFAALELVVDAPGVSVREAAIKEAKRAGQLATGAICKHLLEIFFASEAAKKLGRGSDGFEPRTLERAAVIGAGVMGGGIASVLAQKGVATRMVDLSRDAVDEALIAHRAAVDAKRRRRRLQRHEADAAIDALDGVTELVGLARAQIVVEAVAERLEVKRSLLEGLAEQVAPDCILATNTSSLSVDAIAETIPHPERVVGMHFFNPVPKMPLVEVVRGARTSDAVVTETCALAVRLGKTPVVTKDVAGFLVNRLLGPYLDEAVRLFEGGADPRTVDRAMVAFGMPMGPFTLLDEVGLDIAAHAAASLHAAYGERMAPASVLDGLIEPERRGKKTGRGFYVHAKGRRAPELCDDLGRFQSATFARALGPAEIQERLVLALVNEAARCLEEEVVATARELDLATVFGTGFAPFRGGVLSHADALGLPHVVDRLEAIAALPEVAERPGGSAKFTPAELLRRRSDARAPLRGPTSERAA